MMVAAIEENKDIDLNDDAIKNGDVRTSYDNIEQFISIC